MPGEKSPVSSCGGVHLALISAMTASGFDPHDQLDDRFNRKNHNGILYDTNIIQKNNTPCLCYPRQSIKKQGTHL